jgi:uridine phosphorylase
MEFLKKAHEAGVINIEMESLLFGSFTKKLGVKATTICSCLLNRLNGD